MDGEIRAHIDHAAERDYLASVLLDASVLRDAPLAPEQLDRRWHQKVLTAMLALREQGEEIDTLTLRAAGLDDEPVMALASTIPTQPAGRLRDRLEELAQRRRFLEDVRRLHVEADGDIDAARLSLAELARKGWMTRAEPVPFLSEWGTEVLDQAPPARRWLLRRVIDADTSAGALPLDVAGAIVAAGGVGKTMLMLQLAIAVATGRRLLGAFSVPEPGPVLLIFGEEKREEIQRRLFAAVRHLSREERRLVEERVAPWCRRGENCALLELDEAGNLRDAPALKDIRARAKAAGVQWRLVVLDPLARLAPPEAEKDSQIATRLVGAIESLSELPGSPTVLVVHHTNKASREGGKLDANASRGASALTDGFRWVAALGWMKGAPGGVELSVVKSNYSSPGKPLYLTRDRDDPSLRRMTPTELAEADVVDPNEDVEASW